MKIIKNTRTMKKVQRILNQASYMEGSELPQTPLITSALIHLLGALLAIPSRLFPKPYSPPTASGPFDLSTTFITVHPGQFPMRKTIQATPSRGTIQKWSSQHENN